MTNKVLCSAPFNSVLVESNKTVKPCCSWGGVLGNLNETSMEDIRNGEILRDAQKKMLRHEWPSQCMGCKSREEETGTSVRMNVYNEVEANTDGRLLYYEYNGTNTCNLACAMCGPKWSSSWVLMAKQHNFVSEEEFAQPDWQIHPMNLELAGELFQKTDFTHLQFLWLKGGEPFMNQETQLLLNHLDNIGVLKNIRINVTTNGTIYNPRMLELLGKAKKVGLIVSVDGLGEINKYIRYGYGNEEASDTENIKKNIIKYLELPNLMFLNPGFAVQVYNVFDLDKFYNWWMTEIYSLNKNIVSQGPAFSHIVMYPQQLSPKVLSDETRFKLADYYESLNNPGYYAVLVSYLRSEYAGNKLHNDFVAFTKKIDAIRKKSIVELVPALAKELVEIN